MANLVTYVSSLLKPYYKYILFFILLVIFVTVARFAYQMFAAKKMKKQDSNIANANNMKPITGIYFFHVDWCPHCVKAVPEWNAFVEIYNNKVVNGHIVQCYDIDCTDDNGEVTVQFDPNDGSPTNMSPTPMKVSQLIKKYKIDSYPTIKLTKDNNVVDFEAKVTKQNLIQFVQNV
jgi:thiol-disulfide isomerase/thioredoxin